MIIILKVNGYTFMGDNSVKIVFTSRLKRGLLQKERMGARHSFFLLEQNPFQKGLACSNANRKSQKLNTD